MPAQLDMTAMFDTTDRILNQLRAGEDGLAEFKALRLGDRGVLSPNTEDLAGELVCLRERRRRHHLPRRRRFRRRGRHPAGAPRRGRALDRQHRLAQLRAADSTDSAQGRPPGVHRRGTARASGRGTARPLRAPHVRRALLPARRLHQSRPHAPGARPPVPTARTRVRVRRTARPGRHRRPSQPPPTRGPSSSPSSAQLVPRAPP